jgi:glucoamylase
MGLRSRNAAPGHPGIPARWTSSAKSGVGAAPAVASRVWFTLSHGILNEIYYPRVDYACTRDFGLIVTDGRGYFSEEKRDAASVIRPVDDGVPAFMLRNVSRDGRYIIEKLVLADPRRDVVLQHIRFKAQSGEVGNYRLYALLAPHLVNRGAHNTAWLADHKGREMLFASGSGNALALGCSAPWRARSVGFVGASDGWQDLTRHYALTWAYDLAEDGNVALTGEIDLAACGGEFVLALGFGRRSQEAAHRVIASLNDGVDAALADYTAGWRTWQDGLLPLDRPDGNANTYRISTAHSHA